MTEWENFSYLTDKPLKSCGACIVCFEILNMLSFLFPFKATLLCWLIRNVSRLSKFSCEVIFKLYMYIEYMIIKKIIQRKCFISMQIIHLSIVKYGKIE